MAEKYGVAQFTGQLIVGGEQSRKVRRPGQRPEIARVFVIIIMSLATALAIVTQKVVAPKHYKGVCGDDVELADDPAGRIVAEPENDLNLGCITGMFF